MGFQNAVNSAVGTVAHSTLLKNVSEGYKEQSEAKKLEASNERIRMRDFTKQREAAEARRKLGLEAKQDDAMSRVEELRDSKAAQTLRVYSMLNMMGIDVQGGPKMTPKFRAPVVGGKPDGQE